MWAAFILAQLPETLVDSLTPRADWITIRVSTSHLFQLASPTGEMRTIEGNRGFTSWSNNFKNNIQWNGNVTAGDRSSKDGSIGGIQLNGSMCYVIVTGRSLLWTLLSLVALMAVLSGLITPKWLIGPQMKDTSNYFPLVLLVSLSLIIVRLKELILNGMQ